MAQLPGTGEGSQPEMQHLSPIELEVKMLRAAQGLVLVLCVAPYVLCSPCLSTVVPSCSAMENAVPDVGTVVSIGIAQLCAASSPSGLALWI